MDTLPIQISQQMQAPSQDSPKAPLDRPAGESFSQHLGKKLDTERPKNLLKPKNLQGHPETAQSAPPSVTAAKKTVEQALTQAIPTFQTPNSPITSQTPLAAIATPAIPATQEESIAYLLAQLMVHLQTIATEQGMQAGGYQLTKADEGIISLMAESSGLDPASLSQLLEKLNKGDLTLPDLFSAFSRHFQSLSSEAPITVPDTELPLLASFLQRMGASESTVDAVAAQAVTGDDQLDLTKFLHALDTTTNVTSPESIVLSDVDREQLETLLANAGASREFIEKLFPDKDTQPVKLDLAGLKDTIAKGLVNIDQNRPETELPVFMHELKTLLSQAGFKEEGTSWSPVVQKTMADVQRELGNLVDMATVQVEKAEKTTVSPYPYGEKKPTVLPDGEDNLPIIENNLSVDETANDETAALTAAIPAEAKDSENLFVPVERDTREKIQPNNMTHQTTLTPLTQTQPPVMPDIHATRPAAPPSLPHTSRQLIFQQLTDGIHHGLRNQEHHLVLRLYPPEMGEVKVNLTVRDDHVSVSFAMENQRVKDVIENSMQEFKDNLEQRGFVLNGCNVSVDQQGQGEDLWQRWLEAGEQQELTPSYRNARELDDNYYYRPSISIMADGVNLFI